MDTILSLRDINYSYENQDVLNSISLDIKKGEWITVVGQNGAGKSTLMKLLNGLLSPCAGIITLHDKHLLTNENVWLFREKIGMVFQNPDNQFVATTVYDDIAFGMENKGIERAEMKSRIEEVLEIVQMKGFEKFEPHLLSGGQKQRIAIAGVLVLSPDIIVFDEALSMLDARGRKELLTFFDSLVKEKNITIISVTHDMEEVSKSNRVLLLKDGNIAFDGAPYDFFVTHSTESLDSPNIPYQMKFLKGLQDTGIQLEPFYDNEDRMVEQLCTFISNK